MNNIEDNEKNNDIEEIEVVFGDDSNLEMSGVEEFISDLKPVKEKKKNVVIPVAKKKHESEDKKDWFIF